jgi:hypothetical protein
VGRMAELAPAPAAEKSWANAGVMKSSVQKTAVLISIPLVFDGTKIPRADAWGYGDS